MDLATIQIKVDTREVKSANDEIGKLGKTGQKTSRDLNSANDSVMKSTKNLSGAYKALGGVIAALGIGALATSFKNTVTETERLKGSLVTMTGSTENAAFAFDELLGFASTTPFTLNQSVNAFTKLTSMGLDPSERALKSYGNTAAAMGKDMTQMIEAVADASTGEFERLKEFGIKASSEADRVSFTFQGMTTTVGKNAEEIQEYLLSIGEVNFGGAMEDQMKRLPGLLSNLSDQVTKLFIKIGDSGGIKLFTIAINAASAALGAITDNLEIVGISLAATAAAFVAFSAGTIASQIVAGFGRIKAAVIALNLAIKTNPIAFVVSAITAATVVIISKWDSITAAATKSSVNIEIAWNKLKIFLMQAFAPALTAISDLFAGVQNQAIATWTAVAAAAQDPLNAITAFNETFDETLESLQQGSESSSAFSASISATESRIVELEAELEALNTEADVTDTAFVDASRSLSDFKVEVDETAVAAAAAEEEMEAMRTKALEVLGAISNEQEALHLSNLELDIRNNLQKAGVDATSELGQQIVEATTALHNEKTAIDEAAAAAKQMELDAIAAQKAVEEEAKRIAEEMEERHLEMTGNVKGFLIDLIDNGRDAFDNLGKKFKEMIANMILDWASSKIASIILNTFNGLGTSISSIFSGIFSSIGAGIANAASAAVAAVTGGTSAAVTAVTGGTAAAAGTAAATAGTAAATTAATSGAAAAGVTGAGALAAGTTAAATTAAAAGAGVNAAALAAGSGLGGGAITGGFTAGGSGVLAGSTTTTGLATGSGVVSGGAVSGASTQAAAAASSASSGLASVLKVAGPAALFAYLALKWDIFGLNRPNYPTFEELPPAVQASEMLEAFERTIAPSITGDFPDDTEGQAGFEPMILIDLYQRMKSRLGADASDTLEKIENHPILQNPIYDLLGDIPGLRKGMYNVPHDGFIAELHAGERVMTAAEADSADKMAMDMASLRGSMEEIMIAIARNTAKSYRLYDRWDKNGLPPERAA